MTLDEFKVVANEHAARARKAAIAEEKDRKRREILERYRYMITHFSESDYTTRLKGDCWEAYNRRNGYVLGVGATDDEAYEHIREAFGDA